MSDGVEIVGLSKNYGAFVALNDVNMSIRNGEFITLLGPSGSGKTTLLQMLAGLTAPSGGDILIGGKSVVALPIEKREIGLVFQSYALFPHMTVAGNVGYPLKMRGVARPEIARRVNEVLELVELTNFAKRRPAELSGGQQQRTAIARALVFEPSVMLLDEPLSALDRRLREHMKFELRRLHDMIGTTTIFVTHDQDEALALSDRIAVLDGGKLQQFGTADEIYRQPKTRFIAEFMGETNIIDATVRRGDTGLIAEDDGGRQIVIGQPDGINEGMKVALGIRAEQISLKRSNLAVDGWTGTIKNKFFLGNSYRYIVDCAPHSIVAQVSAPHADEQIATGDLVALTWDPASLQLLPA
ncbi:ABC transporter ATP-binding protein [Paracoccus albus]|uniref:ABC transporter ATP-binding protein n=1 Tax=Paracoccus albus TaxID=3017784 RepID=UPI0022F0E73C|nr:ABC transporter ATP-binding protein [Paracoccus albus]WBU60907.1 ABC transporter ATP-binding protein [Paracoccus albus]